MTRTEKPDAMDAARRFVEDRFPDALVALLGGSAARGEATASSDLDLILLTERPQAPYRESFWDEGWPIEAFVYTPTTYQSWFASDARRRRPSLAAMCAEGVVLCDHQGLAGQLRSEARELLAAGPERLSHEELNASRYRLTDLLMDLEHADGAEAPFVAMALAPALADLICDSHAQWRGDGKWMLRAVKAFSPELAERLSIAVDRLFTYRDRRPLVDLTDEALDGVGGRLFKGYSAGKTIE